MGDVFTSKWEHDEVDMSVSGNEKAVQEKD